MVNEFMEEKRREVEASTPFAPSTGMRHTLVAILSVACLAVWFAPYPSFATGGPSVDELQRELQLEEASARAKLYLAANSVAHFRATQGRLPRTLSEAGVAQHAAIDYRPRTDSVFTLSTHVDSVTLMYDSRTPASSILGRSEELIAKRGH
ncbi:MAG: hypothetical protein ABS52_09105 [Gemmatimonadetes bacterium SCN 70-22]|nr:MAG: hypothetical protein ABS52_09105 [Gemmatimonadetes bacterium SCN 70-22]